jgi:hypothetical protein
MTNSLVVDGASHANLKLNVVPGVWIVELVDNGVTQTVTADNALLAASKVAPAGATLTESNGNRDAAPHETRLVYCDEDDSAKFASVFDASVKIRRIYVKPLLAL